MNRCLKFHKDTIKTSKNFKTSANNHMRNLSNIDGFVNRLILGGDQNDLALTNSLVKYKN